MSQATVHHMIGLLGSSMFSLWFHTRLPSTADLPASATCDEVAQRTVRKDSLNTGIRYV